jgi:hypothetical protein
VDDDVRARIIALARNRPDRAATEFRTPPSPTPPPRRTPSQPPEGFVERRASGANTPPQIQIIHKAAAGLWLSAESWHSSPVGFTGKPGLKPRCPAAGQPRGEYDDEGDSLGSRLEAKPISPVRTRSRQGEGGSPDLGGLAASPGGVSRRGGTEGGRRSTPHSGGNRVAVGGSNGAAPAPHLRAQSSTRGRDDQALVPPNPSPIGRSSPCRAW